MADNNCPYHAEHNSRIIKVEQNYDDLNDRVTALDKEFAVSRAEITGALKNLEKLPETMTQISNTMVTIQNEIKNSNSRTDTRIEGVDGQIEGMEGRLSALDVEVLKINETDNINIRQGFRNWFVKNWTLIGFGIFLAGLYLTDLLKKAVR